MEEKPAMRLRDVLYFLDDNAYSEIQKFFKGRELSQGDVLFEVGDLGEELFFLVRGQLAVKKKTGFENKMQVVALLSQGACVGECGVLEKGVRTTTVVATQSCEMFSLHVGDYKKLRELHPTAALSVIEKLLAVSSLRLHECTSRLAHIL